MQQGKNQDNIRFAEQAIDRLSDQQLDHIIAKTARDKNHMPALRSLMKSVLRSAMRSPIRSGDQAS